MKVLYTRVSTIEQNSERQKMPNMVFDKVIEDKVSGTVEFFNREGGQKIKSLVIDGESFELYVYDIDRLGRTVKDVIITLEYFTEKGINVHIIKQGLSTLLPDGSKNPTATFIINILATVGEMERTKIVERTREGVAIAKMKGLYKGRKVGSKISVDVFLAKPNTKQIVRLLKKNNTIKDIVSMTGSSIGTVMKTKKILEIK